MKRIQEISAPTVEEAVKIGLETFQATEDEVAIDVLVKGSEFQNAIIKIEQEISSVDYAEYFVGTILQKMGIEANVLAVQRDDTVQVEIEGANAHRAIGYRGEVLDALQYLTLTKLNDDKQHFLKVVVNAEGYREKRTATLIELANRLAFKASKLGKNVELEPMNPFERRIIHTALQDSELATTESAGEEPNRHVVIIPKKVEVKQPIDSISRMLQDENFLPQEKKNQPTKYKKFGYKKGF